MSTLTGHHIRVEQMLLLWILLLRLMDMDGLLALVN